MPTEPWAGATYNGFSGPSAAPPPEGPRPPPGGVSRKTLLAGLGCAVAAGLAFGLWARPGDNPRQATATPAPAAAEAPVAKVPVEVVEPAPAETPEATAPLEVLPEEMARAAEANRPVAPPPAPRAPRAPAAPEVAAAPPERDVADTAPDPAPRTADPSFNCRYARSPAEQMVCGDSELAMLDRRLDRAFDRAVGAGVPYRALRREQDDWLSIREDAARRSPEAVASIYRQRIRELNAIAEGGY